jgi:hypothetical protein
MLIGALAAAGCQAANPVSPSPAAVIIFRVSDEMLANVIGL